MKSLRLVAFTATVIFVLSFVIPIHGQQQIALMPALGLPPASFTHTPTITQFLNPGYPEELVSAAKADRIAWLA